MRNTFLATLAALAAMACTATAAQATVYNGASGDECDPVSASGSTVTGGCLIEDMQGTFDLHDGTSIFANGTADFDIRVGPDAHFYVVDQNVSTTPWPRVACDDANGAPLPWPRVTSPIPGTHAIQICLRPSNAGPGGGGTTQTVPFTLGFGQYTNNLVSMTQADNPFGFRNGSFVNGGSTNAEIMIY